jgi:hypothetical protein
MPMSTCRDKILGMTEAVRKEILKFDFRKYRGKLLKRKTS